MRNQITKIALTAFAAALAVAGASSTKAEAAKLTVNNVNAAAVAVKGKVKLNVTKGNKKGLTYKVANSKIATVNKKGVLVGKKAGKTKVTVTNKKKAKGVVNVTVVNKKQALKKVQFAPKKKTVNLASGTAVVKVKFNTKNAAKVKAGKIKANNKKLFKVAKKKVAAVKKVQLVAKKGILKVRVKAKKVGTTNVIYTSLFGKKANVKVTVASSAAVTTNSAVTPAKTNVKVSTNAAVDLYNNADVYKTATTATAVVSGAATGKNILVLNKAAATELSASANVVSVAAIYAKYVAATDKTVTNIGNAKLEFQADAKAGSETKSVKISGAGSAVDGTYKVTGAKLSETAYKFTFEGDAMPYFGGEKTIYIEKATVDGKDAIVISSTNGRAFTITAAGFGLTSGSVVTLV
ncbi:MAG: hypothetical protein K6F77_10125 [Lachnospiraceae bacterium]|nr:hypothetical protein [Lachnospiraceae bacterium]